MSNIIESIYTKYLNRFMPKLQLLVETENGEHKERTYLHKEHLRREYSVDNKWESTTADTTYVAADFVSMDSPMPLKRRDSIATANGKLPKIGISRIMKESDMTAIRIMRSQPGNAQRIADKLANDPIACANGIDERNEFNFLYGFSRGYVGIKDDDKDGALLRLNFGYYDKNTYYASVKGEISLEDIFDVIEKAADAGSTIKYIWIAKKTYNKLRQTREAKELWANYAGQSFTDQTSLPVPTSSKFNEAFSDETGGVEFVVVDRSIQIEKNGNRNPVYPWDENRLIFVTSEYVGTLIYGRLAEQDEPVEGVNYQTIDNFKLIARFRETNPLRETTTGQAMVAPVIENVNQLFVLDLSQSAEVDETAETADTTDQYVTVNGKKYTKSAFIAALNKIGDSGLKPNASDSACIKAVNKLNEAQLAEFNAAVASAVVS